MTTLGFIVFGLFDAIVLLVAVGFCFGDGCSVGSLLALRLFAPFIVGSTGSSAALRLDFEAGFGSADDDATGIAAFSFTELIVAVFAVVVVFEVAVFEATFEAALTPFN
jgi:hypothetical protein